MSKAQRIAFVIPRFSEAGTVGGAETLLKNLAEHAAADGRQVTILTTCATSHFTWQNEIKPGHKTYGKLEVHYFPVDERDIGAYRRIDTVMSRGRKLTESDEEQWIKNSVNSTPLYDHLREHGDDYDRIVAGPYLFGVIYFAAQIHPNKTLLVPCLHDEPFAHMRIMKKLFRSVAGFMFNSDPERDLACDIFNLPKEKCSVVGMGLEPFDTSPDAFARKSRITDPYIIYSGRLEQGKGIPLLCDFMYAFRERTGKDVKLVFTGKGDIAAPQELRPHIVDLGFVSEQEKHDAMAGATAFIHPSVLESFGIVLLESWMARTPVIVHAKCDVLRWQCQRSGGGLWFRSYLEFEQELLLLLEDPKFRRALGAAGRKYVVREYSWASVGERMFKALDEL